MCRNNKLLSTLFLSQGHCLSVVELLQHGVVEDPSSQPSYQIATHYKEGTLCSTNVTYQIGQVIYLPIEGILEHVHPKLA